MGKKCIPGFFCIGNMTLFLVFLMFLFLFYLYLRIADLGNKTPVQVPAQVPAQAQTPLIIMHTPPQNTNTNTLTSLFSPPLQTNHGIPSYDVHYRQIGILTRTNGSEILPLMGRQKRRKWQYYTMTGNNIQMKLPVSVNGKSCTNEYGCDEIYNNDTVYVEGFKDIFIATIYENNTFAYNP